MRYFFLFAVLLILLSSCNQEGKENIKIAGEAQGTTWHITYFSKSKINFTKEIDSLLKAIDTSLSTYLSVSIISRINKNDSSVLADNYFLDVFNKSREVSEKTRGFF